MTTSDPALTSDEDQYLKYMAQLHKPKLEDKLKKEVMRRQQVNKTTRPDDDYDEEELDSGFAKRLPPSTRRQEMSRIEPLVPNVIMCRGPCKRLHPLGSYFFNNRMVTKCSQCREFAKISKKKTKESEGVEYADSYRDDPYEMAKKIVEENKKKRERGRPSKASQEKAKLTKAKQIAKQMMEDEEDEQKQYQAKRQKQSYEDQYDFINDPYSHVREQLRQDPEASVARLHRGSGPKGVRSDRTNYNDREFLESNTTKAKRSGMNLADEANDDKLDARAFDSYSEDDKEAKAYVDHLEKQKGGPLSISEIEALCYE